jgi:hypothetical protein
LHEWPVFDTIRRPYWLMLGEAWLDGLQYRLQAAKTG